MMFDGRFDLLVAVGSERVPGRPAACRNRMPARDRASREETDRERQVRSTLESAAFGLLGLMIAFTYAGAASRFDIRPDADRPGGQCDRHGIPAPRYASF